MEMPRIVRTVLRSYIFYFFCLLAVYFIFLMRSGTHAAAPIEAETLMAAARSYARAPEAAEGPAAGAAETGPASGAPLQNEHAYEVQIAHLFASGEYEQLEQEARDNRASKARLAGGVWRLFDYYDALSFPPTRPQTEADWKAHIAAVKHWNALHPESATARMVLAGSYINYAWFARGHGFSDSVTQEGWELFRERFELAKVALLEAAKLKDKCPYWFELVQMTALAEGWEKPVAKELFEKAAAFEPTYYHFYREYANYLQTKWYGDEGETQDFAEQISAKVGGDDGDMIYFEIATLVGCQCQTERVSLGGMSWPRVQAGYLVLWQKYGTSNVKANRFALLAYSSDDKRAARQAFSSIGENWDNTVWKNKDTFDSVKAWAASE